ncbi:hypothetical protein JOM56_004618 [Amanita muscaria]
MTNERSTTSAYMNLDPSTVSASALTTSSAKTTRKTPASLTKNTGMLPPPTRNPSALTSISLTKNTEILPPPARKPSARPTARKPSAQPTSNPSAHTTTEDAEAITKDSGNAMDKATEVLQLPLKITIQNPLYRNRQFRPPHATSSTHPPGVTPADKELDTIEQDHPSHQSINTDSEEEHEREELEEHDQPDVTMGEESDAEDNTQAAPPDLEPEQEVSPPSHHAQPSIRSETVTAHDIGANVNPTTAANEEASNNATDLFARDWAAQHGSTETEGRKAWRKLSKEARQLWKDRSKELKRAKAT